MVLELENLSFFYGKKQVLKEISLQVKSGEKVGLVGANGSGKSTLMQICAGLIQAPNPARLALFGQRILGLDDFKSFRDKIGYLFQHSLEQFIFPDVLGDVSFELRCAGYSQSEARARASEVLSALNIAELESSLVYDLSGGQQRLVALAGVLARQRELLFLDEPSNELDHEAKHRVCEVLKYSKCAMLIASHDESLIASVCDRVVRI